MTVTDWTAIVAITLSAGALLLEIRRWVESGVQIRLGLMADAVSYPYDDGQEKLVLIVTNVGTLPTTITHMVMHTFKTVFHRILRKPNQSFLVNAISLSSVPAKIEASDIWMGQANYDEVTNELRASGKMFVGVICSNRRRTYLKKVPRKIEAQVSEELAK